MIKATISTLATLNQLATMTTVEIAEYTGKNHQHVRRDTRTMLVDIYGEKDLSRFGQIYKDSYGRDQECYSLPKAEVLCLISGYSAPLRMKIIRRLEELEAGERAASTPLPANFEAQMIGLKYGTNDSSPNNPRETQPHYYEDTFMELFNIVAGV